MIDSDLLTRRIAFGPWQVLDERTSGYRIHWYPRAYSWSACGRVRDLGGPDLSDDEPFGESEDDCVACVELMGGAK